MYAPLWNGFFLSLMTCGLSRLFCRHYRYNYVGCRTERGADGSCCCCRLPINNFYLIAVYSRRMSNLLNDSRKKEKTVVLFFFCFFSNKKLTIGARNCHQFYFSCGFALNKHRNLITCSFTKRNEKRKKNKTNLKFVKSSRNSANHKKMKIMTWTHTDMSY